MELYDPSANEEQVGRKVNFMFAQPLSRRARFLGWWSAAIFLVGWASAVWILALAGVYQPNPATQPFVAVAAIILPSALTVIAALLLMTNLSIFGAVADASPLSWLIGIQVYRVLGFVFLRLWSQGFLPGFFALPAGIGDMLVGALAIPVAFSVRSNSPRARVLAFAWNIFGLIDLLNALSMGAIAAVMHPTLLASSRSASAMSPLLTYPFVIVPAFGVPIAFILHSLSIWQLRRRGNSSSVLSRYGENVSTNMYASGDTIPNTTGIVIHWALRYDLLMWLVTRGRESVYRERVVHLAGLVPGESVLDVGCGTGTLAIAAKRRVGPMGRVRGIDASPEMVARAVRKAADAAVDVVFENAVVEKLPFPDATFDVVLSTMMLHHLPEQARRQCICEIRRVLKPGGRLLAVDFGGPASERRSWIAHLRNHISFDLRNVVPLLTEVGMNSLESGPMGERVGLASDFHYVLAAIPSGT